MGFLPISGGTSDVVDLAVVGIVDDASGGQCTGSLVAPDLVLTAQHCVAAPMNIGPCDQGTFGPPRPAGDFYVTTRSTFTANPGDYHRVAAIVLPPGTGFCGRDIALLRLADRTITSEAASISPRVNLRVDPLEAYSAVGYGATDDNGTGAGERRRRDGLTVSCVGAGCASTYVGDAEWRGQAGVCQGDSGGPALDEAGRVVGVASRGAFGCVDPTYTSIVAHRDWLIATAIDTANAGGYLPPAWTGVAPPPTDAGAVDAPPSDPVDAGGGGDGDDEGGAGGCGCRSGEGEPPASGAIALLAAGWLAIGRRRGTPHPAGSAGRIDTAGPSGLAGSAAFARLLRRLPGREQ